MEHAEVLVVEDEALICDLISAALEEEGVGVACAAGPAEALARMHLHADSLRVLVTDVNLRSDQTGFDVAREARRRMPSIFVIYTTRHAEADIQAEGVPESFVVPKPYVPTQLAERVALLVQQASRLQG